MLTGARASWQAFVGPVTPGYWVCRRPTCSRLCVNPRHLEENTPKEQRQRQRLALGRAKLSEEQVATIKLRLTEGEQQKAIARDFGVAPSTIGAIDLGTTWLHVPWPGFEPDEATA